jgi:hypothetical protein
MYGRDLRQNVRLSWCSGNWTNLYYRVIKSLWAPDVTSNVQSVPRQSHYLAQSDCLAYDRQGQRDTRLTLTPSVIPDCNYVIMVSD